MDGELDVSEDRILAAHLDECAICRAEIAAMAAFQRELVGSCAMHRQQRSLCEGVIAHLPEMDPALNHGSHPTDPGVAPTTYRFRFSIPALACAALVLVVGVLGIVAVYPSAPEVPVADAVGMIVFSEGPGALCKAPDSTRFEPAALKSLVIPGEEVEALEATRMAVALARGSSVKLNARTRITVQDSRNIFVYAGQAFFDVGRDRDHFYVNTPTGEILVYGTSFLVDVAADVTTVTVVEGDVLVRTDEGRSAVSRGKQSALRAGQAPTPPIDAPNDLALEWATSMMLDGDALALFDQSITSHGAPTVALPAEAVFAVRNLGNRIIDGVMLSWDYDGLASGHCGYFLHVSDSSDNLLYLDTIDGRMFDSPKKDSLTIMPGTGPISGVDVIHVRLIPDFTSGTIETNLRVNAVVR